MARNKNLSNRDVKKGLEIDTNDIISIEEARVIIGEEANGMTDIQITKLIKDVDVLATIAVRIAQDELKKE